MRKAIRRYRHFNTEVCAVLFEIVPDGRPQTERVAVVDQLHDQVPACHSVEYADASQQLAFLYGLLYAEAHEKEPKHSDARQLVVDFAAHEH